jgi:hypothetical protein
MTEGRGGRERERERERERDRERETEREILVLFSVTSVNFTSDTFHPSMTLTWPFTWTTEAQPFQPFLYVLESNLWGPFAFLSLHFSLCFSHWLPGCPQR